MPTIKSVETALSLIKNDSSRILDLTVGPHKHITPGQVIPKADAQQAPQLSLTSPASASSAASYIVICLDPDAPFQSLPILSPILHWIQPGLKPAPTPAADGTTTTLSAPSGSSSPVIANYIPPSPPPGSAPHRYIFLLYEQPAGFDDGGKHAPVKGHLARMRYKLAGFEKAAGLGEVVAANWFCSC